MTRTYTALFPFCGLGAGALGLLDAAVTLLGQEHRFVSLGGIDMDADACRDFEALTSSPALCADVSELTPARLRAFAGHEAPDVVFLSPPCQGASALLPSEAAKKPKYQAMNELALVWTRLMFATWDERPRLVLVENVPRIKQRAARMVRELRRLLREAGYVLHDGYHDCGELGGLAQTRKRWLLIARHPGRVSALCYQPPRRRLRGCGEVLSELPLPLDGAVGAPTCRAVPEPPRSDDVGRVVSVPGRGLRVGVPSSALQPRTWAAPQLTPWPACGHTEKRRSDMDQKALTLKRFADARRQLRGAASAIDAVCDDGESVWSAEELLRQVLDATAALGTITDLAESVSGKPLRGTGETLDQALGAIGAELTEKL